MRAAWQTEFGPVAEVLEGGELNTPQHGEGVVLEIDGGHMRGVYSAAWLSSATTPRSHSPM